VKLGGAKQNDIHLARARLACLTEWSVNTISEMILVSLDKIYTHSSIEVQCDPD